MERNCLFLTAYCRSVCPSVCLSVCVSVCVCVCLPVSGLSVWSVCLSHVCIVALHSFHGIIRRSLTHRHTDRHTHRHTDRHTTAPFCFLFLSKLMYSIRNNWNTKKSKAQKILKNCFPACTFQNSRRHCHNKGNMNITNCSPTQELKAPLLCIGSSDPQRYQL